VDLVGRHPSAGITSLSGRITPLKFGSEDLLRCGPRLMEGYPAIRTYRVFPQSGTGAAGPVQHDEDFPALGRHLDPKASAGNIPIDMVFDRSRQFVDYTFGQLYARHLVGPRSGCYLEAK